jgi:hypothetical protein
MGTWCGPDDPGNSDEPRSWGELLRAWFGNPVSPCRRASSTFLRVDQSQKHDRVAMAVVRDRGPR